MTISNACPARDAETPYILLVVRVVPCVHVCHLYWGTEYGQMDELLDFVDPEREVYIFPMFMGAGRARSLPAPEQREQRLIHSLSRRIALSLPCTLST